MPLRRLSTNAPKPKIISPDSKESKPKRQKNNLFRSLQFSPHLFFLIFFQQSSSFSSRNPFPATPKRKKRNEDRGALEERHAFGALRHVEPNGCKGMDFLIFQVGIQKAGLMIFRKLNIKWKNSIVRSLRQLRFFSGEPIPSKITQDRLNQSGKFRLVF